MAPVKVNNNRMHFSIRCAVSHRKIKALENYTFSLGASDVSEMCVYIGHMPSFLIVKTTTKFASVVCKRIGEKVLCPGSNNRKKRYIFLHFDHVYNETYQKAKETQDSFLKHVSPWTHVNVLSSDQALHMLRELL